MAYLFVSTFDGDLEIPSVSLRMTSSVTKYYTCFYFMKET